MQKLVFLGIVISCISYFDTITSAQEKRNVHEDQEVLQWYEANVKNLHQKEKRAFLTFIGLSIEKYKKYNFFLSGYEPFAPEGLFAKIQDIERKYYIWKKSKKNPQLSILFRKFQEEIIVPCSGEQECGKLPKPTNPQEFKKFSECTMPFVDITLDKLYAFKNYIKKQNYE
jgi:hypothetical protein